MNRRALLITGTAAVVIAGAGWALTRAPKAARAPWDAARQGFGDIRLDVLAYAILAPSPHNMQPWRIRLENNNAFSVFCDLERLLPHTDPPSRQITIGFGCFLELVRQAAAEKGYNALIEPFPEGAPYPTLDERPIAHVSLVRDESVERDPLFGGVIDRRTNRLPFDLERAVDEEALQAIKAAAGGGVVADTINDPALMPTLRTLTDEANKTEWETPEARHESIVVMRIGKKEINAEPYGLYLEGPMMEALSAFGFISREKMGEPGASAYEESVKFYTRACETAMAYATIQTETNTRADQLETGRAWLRMQLAANARGIAFHPLSQALQEYPEMAAHYEKAHALLAASEGNTVQMLSRLGYAKSVPPAPREALTSQILEW